MGVRPSAHFKTTQVGAKEKCCSSCGLEPTCVIATFQCYPSKPCECHMHAFQVGQSLVAQANSTACVTGRTPKPSLALSEEQLLNWGV